MAAFGARATETGYVVQPEAGGVRVSLGPVPADQAQRLRTPLRLGPPHIAGLPAEIRDLVETQVRTAAPHEGSVSDLFAAAQITETALREHGFALVRAFVPPQRLRNGDAARIEVIDVRIEALDLAALPPTLASRARQRLASVIDRSFLPSVELTRALGLLQLDAGLPFQVEPVPGSRAERVQLRVLGPTKSWIGEANLGGLSSRPFHHVIASGLATMVLPEDQGRLTLGGTFGRREETQRTGGPLGSVLAVWSKPLDQADGGFVETGVVGLHLQTESPVTHLGVAYDYGRLLWRYGQPLRITSDESLIIKVGPDLTAESFRVGTSVPFRFQDDTLAYTGAMRAEAIWVRQFLPGLSVEANAVGTLGVTQGTHRVTIAGDAASEGETHVIGVLAGRARATVALPLDAVLTVQVRAQYSALGALPISEQFQLFRAGETTVYDPETDQGESGATLRAELGRPIVCPWAFDGTIVTPYVFGGIGMVRTIESLDVQRLIVGSTWGIGSRLALPADAWLPGRLSLGVELYRQTSSGTIPNYTGVSLSLSTKF
ncbi:POTRA domain-containing protein [Methylobacterium haplocladii]|uniref:Uncharacterized protein n=1 Tax=Methylobacterium haplocladii TaxID=1176176 RepID=A0A512IVU8_9HYPH|nr:POTRA domain-containing protein [Methylobacterium haplocladii]GEP01793.1 hypothetical protein MHA02_41800 [Methylobacterium haplocladii]GLS60735.1 hypothetical protein GCM10007887_34200 [Methylobacterium haplocladii]